MKVSECAMPGILLIEPETFGDQRGLFRETYQRERYIAEGIAEDFVQENHSRSAKDVLRGLHFTKCKSQAQIVTVIRGKIFDVVVDIRRSSPTFGKWFGITLANEGLSQIYMPHGFAHGFCVLSDFADLHYKVSQIYDPNDEEGLKWNDADIGIVWPVSEPVVSDRDKRHPLFRELS